MKIIKFRIRNYKSIIDSGDCYFSDKLTILAGKNESGKTSILEALADFDPDKSIRKEANPIDNIGIPEICVTFSLSPEELNGILKDVGLTDQILQVVNLTLIKKSETIKYDLDIESIKNIGFSNVYESSMQQMNSSIEKIIALLKRNEQGVQFPEFNAQEFSDYKIIINEFKNNHPDLIDVNNEVSNIEKIINDYYDKQQKITNFIERFVDLKVPHFILFSSFEDEFPKSIPIEKLKENDWAHDLEKVSNFSIDKMVTGSEQDQFNHEKLVNVDFGKKFDEYWTQDKIKLEIKKDGADIKFWIIERDKSYYPSQRSKGQQWYLSFYVKIVARLSDDKFNVILIDEPGLYLHAKAQKDLLNILLTYTKDNPVVFSTHSPYLITEDNLENIRLIEKNDKGTEILGKIHAHSMANKETLTPILTAIGLGVNDSITNLDQKNNVVVEGPEDVFYLRAFKELVRDDLNINFINGGGAPNMGLVGAILDGWGACVYYLYDNDKGKKDGVKKLKAWKISSQLIKVVLKEENSTIVDILSPKDFKNYVLDKPQLEYSLSNSGYIKQNQKEYDKVLLARTFLQKVRKDKTIIVLEKKSTENINKLFDNLNNL